MNITKEIRDFVNNTVDNKIEKLRIEKKKKEENEYNEIDKKYHSAFCEEVNVIIEKYKNLIEKDFPQYVAHPGTTWSLLRKRNSDNTKIFLNYDTSRDISTNVLAQLSLIRKVDSTADIEKIIDMEIKKYLND